MQQNYRRAFAQHAVNDFRITAFYLLKSHSLDRVRYEVITRCAPTAAVSSSGSSGITIQAMG